MAATEQDACREYARDVGRVNLRDLIYPFYG